MKKLIVIIQVVVLAAAVWGLTPAAAAEYPFNKNSVTIISGNDGLGSIYYDDEDPGFIIQIKNPTSNEYDVNLKLEVYDMNQNVIWRKVYESTKLGAKATNSRSFFPEVDKYGILTIKATLTGNFDEIVAERNFSRVAKNETRDDITAAQLHFSNLYGYEKEPQTIHLLENGGIGYIRDGYNWSYVETELSADGNEKIYSFPQWRDDNINNLIDAGNKFILILGVLNPLYDDNTLPYSDEGIAAYASFCAAVAEHFRGRIDTFEIGNEPDHINFAKRDASGDEYARLLKAAYDAIKKVDERITVIGGSLCSHRSVENQEFLAEFVDEMNANGGWKKYMDGISYHPYSSDGDYSDEVEYMTFLQNADYIQDVVGEDIPLWITEYGLSTYQDESGKYVVSEEMQAADLVRTITAAKSNPLIRQVSIYNFRKTWPSLTEREHNFGIVYEDYSAKPAYAAVSYMNRVLKGAEYVGKLADSDYYSAKEIAAGKANRPFDIYRFKRGQEEIMVLWEHTGKTSRLTVDNTNNGITGISQSGDNITISANKSKTIEVYDMYGNIIEGTSVELSEKPVFVRCRPGISITENGDAAVIAGQANPVSNLTLLARRRGSLAKEILAIGQTVSDENGNFSFRIRIPENDAYTLYIAESSKIQSMNMRSVDYEIDALCSVDGVEITSADSLKSGTTLDIALKMTDYKGFGKNFIFTGVLVSKNGAVLAAEMNKTEWNNNTAEIDFSIEIDDAEDIESIKMLLWDENFAPASSSFVLK